MMNDRSGTPISRKVRRREERRRRHRAGVAAAATPLPLSRVAAVLAAPAVCLMLSASAAWADGTFRVTVHSAVDGTPINAAIVTLDETQGRELRQTVPTDATGLATTKTLSDGTYRIFASAAGFQASQPVEVELSGNTVSLDIQLKPVGILKVSNIAALQILNPYDTTISTTRTQDFLRRFPLTEGNEQSLPLALRAFPGFVYDGLNQIHPRGDQNGIAYYIDGLLIPQFAAGHISQVLSPQAFESIRAITGNFSAEYGGQTGAVLDLTSRPPDGRITPYPSTTGPEASGPHPSAFFHKGFLEAGVSTGEYNTWQNYVSFGDTVNAVGFHLGRRRHSRTGTAASSEEPQAPETPPVAPPPAPVTVPGTETPTAPTAPAGPTAPAPPVTTTPAPQTTTTPSTETPTAPTTTMPTSSTAAAAASAAAAAPAVPAVPFVPKLHYSFSLSQRYSGVGVEPPQSGSQSAENRYSSEISFGDVALDMSPSTRVSALFNYSSGRNGVADRTAMNGFLGLNTPPVATNQQQEDKRERQKDNESFSFLRFTHKLKSAGQPADLDNSAAPTVNLAIGAARSDIALFEQGAISSAVVPPNASTEYYSVVGQTYDIAEFEGDYTRPTFYPNNDQAHLFKLGFVYQDQKGTESYFLAPFSQEAAAALQAIYSPLGISFGGSNVLFIKRTGNYGALYGEDTWKLSALPMVVNYGVRLDSYKGSNNFEQGSVSKSDLSPRVNIAYTVPQRTRLLRFLGKEPTILRAGFDHLFTQPQELGQGLIAGKLGIQPERTDQMDFSIEHQLNLMQVVKLNLYHKDIKSALFISQLVPGTQDGPFTTYNQGDATVDGTELEYDYNPRDQRGLGGYLVFSNSSAKPKKNDFDNVGNPITNYLSQDQRNTMSFGVSYTAKNGMYGGFDFVYGSGVYASTDPLYTQTGSRKSNSELNVRFGSGPQYLQKHLGWTLGVENLTNSRDLIDLRSPYAGTRYQMGTRILLGVNATY